MLCAFAVLLMACNGRNKAEERVFEMQLGKYVLDTSKTILTGYEHQAGLYNKLEVVFNADSTFRLNMQVPFIYDSAGKWKAGDGTPYSYNELIFGNGITDQFYPPYSGDSIFLLNSGTPKAGARSVNEIYFRKIK